MLNIPNYRKLYALSEYFWLILSKMCCKPLKKCLQTPLNFANPFLFDSKNEIILKINIPVESFRALQFGFKKSKN
ncbi:hypothetical protein BpHYR1_021032 [Brachionus plicatilis]|uniref:Uncharacterized protein n=1 Tax=Brachionus plicatilis TaxID=10195 RepID=A0A3M7P528_BRAPC|nr:hypothetical protein BpHYR1_021032 [Brachionus plicatilis]